MLIIVWTNALSIYQETSSFMLNSNGHRMLQKKADSTYVPCVFRWDTGHSGPSSFLGDSHPCAQVPPGATATAQPWSALLRLPHCLNLVLQPMLDRHQPSLILWELVKQDNVLALRYQKISSLIIFSELVWVLIFQQMLINALIFTLSLLGPILKRGLHAKLKTGNMKGNKITI